MVGGGGKKTAKEKNINAQQYHQKFEGKKEKKNNLIQRVTEASESRLKIQDYNNSGRYSWMKSIES